MPTGQLTPKQILLGPALALLGPLTSDDENLTPYLLEDSTENPGFLTNVRRWDLVHNTTDDTSAHVLQVVAANQLRLDKDIFTAVTKTYKIYRPAIYRLAPPIGLDYTFMNFLAYHPRADDKVGIEIQFFNAVGNRRQFLARTDANGVLDLQGRNHQVTRLNNILVVNYTTWNATVQVEGVNHTMPRELWAPVLP